MLFAPKTFSAIMEKNLKNADIVRVRSLITMIIGFLFLTVYQKFDNGRAMTFSIFGYLSLIKGLVLLRFPARGYAKYKRFYKTSTGLLVTGLVVALFAFFVARIALIKI